MKLDETTLALEVHDNTIFRVSWDSPTENILYVVSATVVSTGEVVEQPRIVAFEVDSKPHVDFQLSKYTCEQVNISIHIFNSNESMARVVTPSACTFTCSTEHYTMISFL